MDLNYRILHVLSDVSMVITTAMKVVYNAQAIVGNVQMARHVHNATVASIYLTVHVFQLVLMEHTLVQEFANLVIYLVLFVQEA
jgi:hypothetical protein